jgi:hypothetical protein
MDPNPTMDLNPTMDSNSTTDSIKRALDNPVVPDEKRQRIEDLSTITLLEQNLISILNSMCITPISLQTIKEIKEIYQQCIKIKKVCYGADELTKTPQYCVDNNAIIACSGCGRLYKVINSSDVELYIFVNTPFICKHNMQVYQISDDTIQLTARIMDKFINPLCKFMDNLNTELFDFIGDVFYNCKIIPNDDKYSHTPNYYDGEYDIIRSRKIMDIHKTCGNIIYCEIKYIH